MKLARHHLLRQGNRSGECFDQVLDRRLSELDHVAREYLRNTAHSRAHDEQSATEVPRHKQVDRVCRARNSE